jgi:hypothetical protein
MLLSQPPEKLVSATVLCQGMISVVPYYVRNMPGF